MEYTLIAPRVFENIVQVDTLCLPKNKQYTHEDSVMIDLSKVEFIKPLGVIGVLLLVEYFTQKPIDKSPLIKIVPPEDGEVTDYLLKIKFVDALKLLYTWDIPEGLRASGGKIKPVIPITRFRTAQDIENIAHFMQEIFRTEMMGLNSLLQPCHVVFSELANNAVEHANSNGGFVLAQKYDYTEGSRIEIAVGDCGIGIPRSLKQKKSNKRLFDNDRQAIMLVLRGGFSRINDPHRGQGLYWVKEEMTHAPDRSLTLRSGNGYVILSTEGNPYSAECMHFPGTLAHAVIPC
jgi:hypothetical protein